MSIKIYDAYRVRMPLIEMQRMFAKLGIIFRRRAEQEQKRILAQRYEQRLDAPLRTWDGQGEPPVADDDIFWPVTEAAWEEMEQARLEKGGVSELDFSCRVQVFPLANDEFLLRVLTWQPEFIRYFDDHPAFEDFHYQNSTDHPDSIDESTWDSRLASWELAMPALESPACHSLLVTLVDFDIPLLRPVEACKYARSRKARARSIAESRVFTRYARDKGLLDKRGCPSRVSDIIEFKRRVRKGEFDFEIEAMAAQLEAHVQPLPGPDSIAMP